jgi:hypothetical protein
VLLEALLASAVTLGGASATDPAWRRADLSHLLHGGQQKIQAKLTESPHQLQVVLCARGFGKTYWGASLAVSQALKKPKSKIKIGTEFQTDLESLILPNFQAVLEGCPDELQPQWKATKSKYTFHNGSEIALIGLDRKPNGLRGQHGVDLIILEEAGFISKLEALYRSVIVPTTTHRPECKIVLISTPPESLDHYFWSFVDRAELEGSLSTFTIDENPMLKPHDVARIEKEMGGRSSTQFQREYLCRRVAEESRMLVPEFAANLPAYVVESHRDDLFQFFLKSSALDSGVRDLTTGLWGFYDFREAKVKIEDELVLGGKDVLTQTIFNRTREIESHLEYTRVRRHADNDNLILIQDLNSLAAKSNFRSGFQDESIHWVPTRKDSLEASINLVRTWFNADRIRIHPRCKHLIGTLKTALWNKQRTDIQRSETYGHGDALMALVYLIRNLDVHTNPIPQTYGADLANAVVFQRPTKSDNVEALVRAFGGKRK